MRVLLAVVTALLLAAAASAQTPGPGEPGLEGRFSEQFRRADANGDGRISEAEAQSAGLWFKQDLGSVDADHSGTVTLFEFAQALQLRLRQPLSDFDAADLDHDGVLSEEELKRAPPSLIEIFTVGTRAKPSSVSRPEYESYVADRLSRESNELPSVVPNLIEKKF